MIAALSKYIFITIFIGSAISKIVGFDDTLIYFVGLTNLPFQLLASLLWILIILEILIPVLVLMNGLRFKTLYLSIQLLLITFLIINILFFFVGAETCACFGANIKSYPSLGILKALFLIMIVYYMQDGKLFSSRFRIRKNRR
jgi:hypothetical protein